MAIKLPYDFPLEPPLTDYSRRYFEEMCVLIQKHFELISGTVNNLSGVGGAGGPHATTHYVTGDDPVDITKLAGYPGGTTTFLRDDGTWAEGVTGPPGPPGPQGLPGEPGPSASVFYYQADALSQQMQDPGSGFVRWNTEVQADATRIAIDWLTDRGFDAHLFFELTEPASEIIIQAADLANTHQVWKLLEVFPSTDWFSIAVELVSQDGPGGLCEFAHNERLAIIIQSKGRALNESFITLNDEPTLANAWQIVAGTGVALDSSVPGQLTINATGGGTGGGMNLDYLGAYPAAPVYYDGDIVIGPDGIAYMCVVDGTTTGPEPWPGVGISSSVGPPGPTGPQGEQGVQGPPGQTGPIGPVVDGTYWMVSNHPTLVSERALNLLANGYVKSIWGEPSTVAVIPVSEGGTGATDTGTARTNLGLGNVSTVNFNGSSAYYLRGDGVWATIPDQIPQHMVAMFWEGCPAGWARAPWWDGYFFRSMPSYTGQALGATNHYHGADGGLYMPAHTHTVSGMTLPSHNHGGLIGIDGRTDNDGEHSHAFGVHTTTGMNNQGNMNVDGGNSGFMSRGDHNHNIDYSDNTNNAGLHSHHLAITGGIPSDGGQGLSGTVSTLAQTAIGGTTGYATNHYPPFFDMIYCYKV